MKMKEMTKRFALEYLPHRLLKVARSLHYRRSLRNYDMAAEPDLYACRSLIKPGDTVIDVGANIGVYTRFCSEFVGPAGRVVSLEPVPETFSYLTKNVRALGLKNVECLNVAASDYNSNSDRMSVPEYSMGGSNLYEAKLLPEGNVLVKTATLDSLFPSLNPAFIKCDVEGQEVACVKGALNLINRCHPRWMVEVSNAETFELFRSLDYSVFYYEESGFRPFSPGQRRANYFFFPTS